MRHKWVKAEDRTIARYIILFDKPAAFKKYSKDFGVTEKSVTSRYYRNKKYIDFWALYQIIIPPEKWYKKLWKSIKNMLNILKFI